MSLPKYKYLLTYRYSEIIFDLNSEFCTKYISRMSRTFDQMIQAARSGKQNNEIKLLGYAKGSFEELLADYEDYCRQRNLPIYPKTSTKVLHFRQYGYRLSNLSNLSNLGNLIDRAILPTTPEEVANFMITLTHMETYLLDRQIKAQIEKFQKEGGFSEQLLRGRISYGK